MCGVCGCGEGEVRWDAGARSGTGSGHAHHGHDHAGHAHHDHDHAGHDHAGGAGRLLAVERDILAKNDRYAAANRAGLAAAGVRAFNLMSSPGAGKTSLLVATIAALKDELSLAVIEGDQETANDAQRIRAAGVEAVQINTGRGCHLDAHMVGHALESLDLKAGSLLFIENVGNLVCPAAFDLGEARRVALLSLAEGDDKPIKYPEMFMAADLMILTKTDLAPHVDFSPARAIEHARCVNERIEVIALSARTGEGMAEWCDWLRSHADAAHGAVPAAPPPRARHA